MLGKRAVAAPGLELKPRSGLRPRDVEAEPGAAGDPRLDGIRSGERGTAGGGGGWPVPAFVALGGLAGPQVDGAAVDGPVARVVLLSGRGEPEAEAAERLVQDGPLPWTILRCSWFAQNFSEAFLLDPVLGGEVALPVDGVTEPFVDCDDIAEVAAEALLDDRHAGQLYELTGPRLLTFGDAIREIARAAERPIRFTAIPPEEFTAGLAAAGLSRDEVSLVSYLFATVLDGRNSSLTDGVEQALGRPPRDFADYARETAKTGIWSSR